MKTEVNDVDDLYRQVFCSFEEGTMLIRVKTSEIVYLRNNSGLSSSVLDYLNKFGFSPLNPKSSLERNSTAKIHKLYLIYKGKFHLSLFSIDYLRSFHQCAYRITS